MATEHDAIAMAVIRQSQAARFARTAAMTWITAWNDSRVARLLRLSGVDVSQVPVVARVRLVGLLLLVATMVHAVVLPWTPPTTRPALPEALHLSSAALAIVLLGTAPAIARAWPRSRLRRVLPNR